MGVNVKEDVMTWKDQHDLRINMSELATKVLASRGIHFPVGLDVAPTELARQIQDYGQIHSTEYVRLLQNIGNAKAVKEEVKPPPADWVNDSYG